MGYNGLHMGYTWNGAQLGWPSQPQLTFFTHGVIFISALPPRLHSSHISCCPTFRDAKGASAPDRLLPTASGQELRKAQATARASVRPTAIVGFPEHIFSDKAGALGAFAASAEWAFSTIVQRTVSVRHDITD